MTIKKTTTITMAHNPALTVPSKVKSQLEWGSTDGVQPIMPNQQTNINKRCQSKSIRKENTNMISISPKTPVFCPGDSRVHRTALEELGRTLNTQAPLGVSRSAEAPAGSIHLALLDESPVCRELVKKGIINLHNQEPGTDAFAVVDYMDALILIGTTPRGMLHAVYWIADRLALGKGIPAGVRIEQSFQISRRIFHPRFDSYIFHPRLDCWPDARSDIRYLSHIGATHCLVDHDWQGSLRNFQGYVTSPIFPDAVDSATVARQHDNLRQLLEDCADYGLEPCLWLTELPCQGGPWVPEPQRQEFLKRFPSEVLSDSGCYEGRVLCFSHPQIQDYYRDLIKRFFAEFTEFGILFVFGLDSGGRFCSPTCPRCNGMSLFDQRDRFLAFLREEGGKVRPGLQVLTTGWEWDHEPAAFLEHQRQLPEGCGVFLAAEKDGWQVERQSHDFLRDVRKICRDRNQLFIGYDNFHWGDDTVFGLRDIQDFPLGIGAKIRRWRQLDVDGVFDHWGTWSEDISSNSIACRAFFLNPLADPDTVGLELAHDQFGESAGPQVFAAWQALERAHAILSKACTWSPKQWIGWYIGRNSLPIPDVFATVVAGKDSNWRMGGEALKTNGAFSYNAGTFGDLLLAVSDAWHQASPHYQAAISAMSSALECADNTPVGYAHWWSGSQSVPSRLEHIRRQLMYLESMAVTGREIGLHFGLFALYEKSSRDAALFQHVAVDLLLADHAACLVVAEFFEKLGDKCPDAQKSWVGLYRKKALGIAEYLSAF